MPQNATLYKRLFFISSLVILILMPVLSRDFGQTGDEDVEVAYGQDIWNYFVHGNKQALNYDNHPYYGANIKNMELYGGMFDFLNEAIHHAFPGWHVIDIRHFTGSIFGAFMMIFTGLIAYRLSGKKWHIALLALIFMAFSPRMFGESMNNGKDIPFCMGFTMGIYYLIRILQDFNIKKTLWNEAILLGVSWGIVFGMRSAGGLIFLAYVVLFIGLFFFVNKTERSQLFADKKSVFKKLLLYFLSAFFIGSALGLLTWPYGLQAPVQNLFTALKEMSNRSVGIKVLFDGKYTNSMLLPWYYEFKWILISSPVIVVLLALLFIPLLPKGLKTYGFFSVFLIVFSATFPILYIIYKKSTVYDTWRHVFFVYPFWVAAASLSVDLIMLLFQNGKKWIPYGVALAALIPAVIWTVKSHPNQYVYFNEFQGGVRGAFGKYDLDYYHNSGKEMAEWILKHAKRPPAGQKIKVLSNMDGMDTYFRNDTSWISYGYGRYYERNQLDWDYYVTFGRFVSLWQLENGKWPPANAVFMVTEDDTPLGVVLERKSRDAYLAYTALQNKDYINAIKLYESYIKTDSSDEMIFLNYALALAYGNQPDKAIEMMQKAIQLNGERPDFYQIMAQIYQAKGDSANAQKAMMTAQSMAAQQIIEE